MLCHPQPCLSITCQFVDDRHVSPVKHRYLNREMSSLGSSWWDRLEKRDQADGLADRAAGVEPVMQLNDGHKPGGWSRSRPRVGNDDLVIDYSHLIEEDEFGPLEEEASPSKHRVSAVGHSQFGCGHSLVEDWLWTQLHSVVCS